MILKKINFIILSVIIILISGCQGEKYSFSSNSEEVKKLIDLQSSEIDYKKYLDIDMKTEFRRTSVTFEGTEDKDYSALIQRLIIENITNENILLNLKLFIPDELDSSIRFGPPTLGPREKDINLKPGERINISFGTPIKRIDLLTASQNELVNNLKDTLYIELEINGKKDYIKITSNMEK